jgi:integrase
MRRIAISRGRCRACCAPIAAGAQGGGTDLADAAPAAGDLRRDRPRPARPGAAAARLVGALRRSELVSLHVEDVAVVAGGLRLRIRRGKTDPAGQGAELGLPRGRSAETCPVRASPAGRR